MTHSFKVKQQGNIFESSGNDTILQGHLADYRDLIRIISNCRCCQAEFKQLQLSKNKVKFDLTRTVPQIVLARPNDRISEDRI
jgi:hypothetical protein